MAKDGYRFPALIILKLQNTRTTDPFYQGSFQAPQFPGYGRESEGIWIYWIKPCLNKR